MANKTLFKSLVGKLVPAADARNKHGAPAYELTPKQADGHLAWYQRPATLGLVVLGLTLVLNIIFW
jgi:hypothetical protein